MNEQPLEKKLSRIRPQPTKRYYNKVADAPWTRGQKEQQKMYTENITPNRRKFAVVFAALLAVFSIALTSPEVRAAVQQVIVTIGNIDFTISDEKPISSESTVEPFDEEITVGIDPDDQFTIGIDEETAPLGFMSKADAEAVGIKFPLDLPEGVRLQGSTVIKTDFGDGKYLYTASYINENDILLFTLVVFNHEIGWRVGEEANLEEVTLADGTVAALSNGSWNVDTDQFDASVSTKLSWLQDGFTYTLDSHTGLTGDELIIIANSID